MSLSKMVKNCLAFLLGLFGLHGELFRVKKRIAEVQSANKEIIQQLDQLSREFVERRAAFEEFADDQQKQLRQLEKHNRNLSKTLQEAREQIEIYEEITIPNLKKLLDTFSTAYDYQSAANARGLASLHQFKVYTEDQK